MLHTPQAAEDKHTTACTWLPLPVFCKNVLSKTFVDWTIFNKFIPTAGSSAEIEWKWVLRAAGLKKKSVYLLTALGQAHDFAACLYIARNLHYGIYSVSPYNRLQLKPDTIEPVQETHMRVAHRCAVWPVYLVVSNLLSVGHVACSFNCGPSTGWGKV